LNHQRPDAVLVVEVIEVDRVLVLVVVLLVVELVAEVVVVVVIKLKYTAARKYCPQRWV